MIFTKLSVKDAWLIKPNLHKDNRGVFRRSFCKDKYSKNGLDNDMCQGNISENPNLGTLRGFHYQIGIYKEAKTITCITGSIYNVIIDLRENSPTFLKHNNLVISSSDKNSIYIPKGCANAWLTLESNTIIHYYMSASYKPGYDRGIRFDDPFFNIKWPFAPNCISEKDLNYKNFEYKKML